MKPLLVFLAFTHFAFALETVNVKKSVVINQPIEKVCSFVSNPMNDHLWRSEVNEMSIEGGELMEGAVIVEDAWIGLQRNFITKTEVIRLDCPYDALFITTKDNPFYLQSHRIFEALDENRTKFTYDVEFDVRMISETLGLNINPQLVARGYGFKMWSYLQKLRQVIK
ncbi:MAG: SRPBCC family protein [Deltaproteobacteria bacterium]|nr:MAG: SRPBCC family protein [Deltaproteobacteria bacterium]